MADDEDEDVLDSWEDADESEEFERRMEEHERSLRSADIQEEIIETNSQTGSVAILKPEHAGKTDYTPQIKILRRSANQNIKKNTPKQKTEAELKEALKMKEAEYLAARNRILGKNYDETLTKIEEPEPEINDMRISIIKNPNRSAPSSPSLERQDTIIHAIIRQPRGPDDSAGFELAR